MFAQSALYLFIVTHLCKRGHSKPAFQARKFIGANLLSSHGESNTINQTYSEVPDYSTTQNLGGVLVGDCMDSSFPNVLVGSLCREPGPLENMCLSNPPIKASIGFIFALSHVSSGLPA